MNPKILIVDDEPINILLIKVYLEASEYKVISAASGFKAFEYMDNEIPDIVLLDLMMPDMSGMEVLTKMASIDKLKNIPVIMISGENHPSTVRTALSLGAKHYLFKPISLSELLMLIKKCIETEFVKANSFDITNS